MPNTEEQGRQIAQWLLARLGDLPVKFNDGGHTPVVARWVNDIATGRLVVSEAEPVQPVADLEDGPETSEDSSSA